MKFTLSGAHGSFGEGVLQHRPSPLCTPKHQPQLLRGKLMRGIDSEPLSASGSSQAASTIPIPAISQCWTP